MDDTDLINKEPNAPNMDNQEGEIPNPMGFADLVYGVLFNPAATFRSISQEPPVFQGFIIYLVIVGLTSLVNALVPPDVSGMSPEVGQIIATLGPFIGIIAALFSFLAWIIKAGVYQLFAELLGGKGRAVGVLTVLALADLPRVLVIPFQIISFYAAESFLSGFLTIAVSLAGFVWGLVLLVIGFREIHQFSTGKAIVNLLIPLGIMLFVIIIMVFALVGLGLAAAGSTFPS